MYGHALATCDLVPRYKDDLIIYLCSKKATTKDAISYFYWKLKMLVIYRKPISWIFHTLLVSRNWTFLSKFEFLLNNHSIKIFNQTCWTYQRSINVLKIVLVTFHFMISLIYIWISHNRIPAIIWIQPHFCMLLILFIPIFSMLH